eukprot:TRINITY_DN856_c0_g1_i2.p1 TRINITY_DN856_c0_g1~~TRINITY_DN856_c0_g1_i2.p1  ORF type:complete len:110 (+),score=22.72 TRINITY_DN856_c0_g1_i2:349-678(+)
MPGGYVDLGETVEQTVVREVKEETGLSLEQGACRQFHIYSDPKRDTRRHTITTVFICRTNNCDGVKGGDDASSAVVVSKKKIIDGEVKLVFDHLNILKDFFNRRYKMGE